MDGAALSRSRLAAAALVAALAAGTTALLAATGFDVARAFAALLRGSVGSWYAIGSGTLIRATPLILTGLAVAVAFRAGVFNIGAEGQFVMGAIAATAVALVAGALPSPVALAFVLVAGALAGGAWASIAAVLRARFHVLEVISTIMLNFVAGFAVSYLVRGPLQEHTRVYPQTETIGVATRLPRLASGTRLHAGFLIACVACAVLWWYVRYTAGGFRLRAVGANPSAARSAGQIDVTRVASGAFVASGALAGLAGAIEVSGVTYALYENISPGYGYTAIAVALLARLDAFGVLATGIMFGALEAGAAAMQRDAGVPSVLVTVIEACVVLAFVALGRARIAGRGTAT
jgi:general nucleoside transport system permease protein